ncbi:MAG: hypothetical protein FK732_09180 [Asgard group archaeon]|nr:hypothetical protein [Asgard group archaeon]
MENYSDNFYLVRSLTDDFVFCPKCGTKNIFRLGRDGSELRYFCERCSERLNDFWDSAQAGQLLITGCESCQQSTFAKLKYCISCGSIQRRVARKRAQEISSTIGDSQLKEDIRKIAGGDDFLVPGSRIPLKIIISIIVGFIFVVVLALILYFWFLRFF